MTVVFINRALCCFLQQHERRLTFKGRQVSSLEQTRSGSGPASMGRKGVLLADPISDLLTRIRNGQAARRTTILHPYSRTTAAIVSALIRLGYLASMRIVPPESPRAPQFDRLEVTLKYDIEGNPAIRRIRRVSKPSKRIYRRIANLPLASAGLGSWILSTPKGILHCAEARESQLGGEVLAEIF